MSKKIEDFDFDFTPLGHAIKQAREAKGITREKIAERLNYAPRHIQAVENDGQYPSVELLFYLVIMFDISVDEEQTNRKNFDSQTLGYASRSVG